VFFQGVSPKIPVLKNTTEYIFRAGTSALPNKQIAENINHAIMEKKQNERTEENASQPVASGVLRSHETGASQG
jgi:hypothetical protein